MRESLTGAADYPIRRPLPLRLPVFVSSPRFVAPSLYGASRPVPGQFIGARSRHAGTAVVGWNKSIDIPRVHSAGGRPEAGDTFAPQNDGGLPKLHQRAIGD